MHRPVSRSSSARAPKDSRAEKAGIGKTVGRRNTRQNVIVKSELFTVDTFQIRELLQFNLQILQTACRNFLCEAGGVRIAVLVGDLNLWLGKQRGIVNDRFLSGCVG